MERIASITIYCCKFPTDCKKGKGTMTTLLGHLCIPGPSHQNMWHMALNMSPLLYSSIKSSPVTVLKSGMVASKSFPVLGATPDAKVVNFGSSMCFSLAEVKCSHTKFHMTPLDACSDPGFFIKKISANQCRLRRDHAYYAQVKGRMDVTGAKLCDFIVYTSKGLYVERIAFYAVVRNSVIIELYRFVTSDRQVDRSISCCAMVNTTIV